MSNFNQNNYNKNPLETATPGLNDVDPNARTMPRWMDKNGTYGDRIILLLTPEQGNCLPRNPFIVGRTIEQLCGKIESADTEDNDTKYVLKMRSIEQAKKLLGLKQLLDGTKINVISHPRLNQSRCVVNCRQALHTQEDELISELSDQGVINVKRITRTEGDNKINTPMLILTLTGTVVPKHIFFGLIRTQTRPFYPTPMMCFNCYHYGHTGQRCKHQAICRNCATSHEFKDGNNCDRQPKCKNCNGEHPATNRKCPVYLKEAKIIKIKINS